MVDTFTTVGAVIASGGFLVAVLALVRKVRLSDAKFHGDYKASVSVGDDLKVVNVDVRRVGGDIVGVEVGTVVGVNVNTDLKSTKRGDPASSDAALSGEDKR